MARQVSYQLIDDFDQSIIPDGSGSSIRFAIEGKAYVIDLSDSNAARFFREMKVWTDAARPDGGEREDFVLTTPAERRAIRAWASEEGIRIGNRGQIAREVVHSYRKAHGLLARDTEASHPKRVTKQ
ncbi:Lsr2 dimerization domain-containing protein [Leifsonia aquatica]|uniref:Lsr2 dimerization domain-containing protein n=1 Tax=Leifsonia aquatica TaxID=144185 RepID=UPI0037F40928